MQTTYRNATEESGQMQELENREIYRKLEIHTGLLNHCLGCYLNELKTDHVQEDIPFYFEQCVLQQLDNIKFYVTLYKLMKEREHAAKAGEEQSSDKQEHSGDDFEWKTAESGCSSSSEQCEKVQD